MSGERTGTRVVIADDDPDIRTLVGIAVRKAGLTLAAESPDGDDAWLAIERERPSLVVLDVSMPGKTGFELAQLMRADKRFDETTILLLSAAVDEQSRAAGLASGASEFLVKPFSPRELAGRLAQIVDDSDVR